MTTVKYIYVVKTEYRDHYSGYGFNENIFGTLTEAWRYYSHYSKFIKKYKEKCFYMVHKPRLVIRCVGERQPKHGLVLGYNPHRK